jgi:hypothetical protein
MRSLYLAAGAAAAAVLGAWLLVFKPRMELAATQLDPAQAALAAAGLRDLERLATIDRQAEQLAAVLENEVRNRELLAQISKQGRAHSAALQELKRNDKAILEYLDQPVPADLGRLYQRTGGTDPAAYRQPAAVPADALPAAGPASAAGE